MSSLTLDAEALYAEALLRRRARHLLRPACRLVGVTVGRGLAGRAAAARSAAARASRGVDLLARCTAMTSRARGLASGADADPDCRLTSKAAAHPAGGRRALHRAHHPRRDQRAVRLWPPGQRAAGGAGGPRRPRAARSQADFAAARVPLPPSQTLALARDARRAASAFEAARPR